MSDWQPAKTAPTDGTVFIGEFNHPWPLICVFDGMSKRWSVAEVKCYSCSDTDHYRRFERKAKQRYELLRWQPLPPYHSVE